MAGTTVAPRRTHTTQSYKVVGFSSSEHKQRGDPRPNLITPREYEQIQAEIIQHVNRKCYYYRTLFAMGRYLGLRVGEAVRVHIDDVNFQDNYVLIPEQKSGHPRQRQPMPYKLKQKLLRFVDRYADEIQDSDGYLFYSKYSDTHIRTSTVQMFLHRLRQRSNYPLLSEPYAEKADGDKLYAFHYHSLRHLYIQQVCDSHGVRKAQVLARHKSIQSTMQYLHSSLRKKKSVVNDVF